jgi:hypothetical protein
MPLTISAAASPQAHQTPLLENSIFGSSSSAPLPSGLPHKFVQERTLHAPVWRRLRATERKTAGAIGVKVGLGLRGPSRSCSQEPTELGASAMVTGVYLA